MSKAWFTSLELAKLALPGLPRDKRAINRLADREHWKTKLQPGGEPAARRRKAVGGGFEYHVSILPTATTRELVKRGICDEVIRPIDKKVIARSACWASYEAAGDIKKAVAQFRLDVVQDIHRLCDAGKSKSAAVAQVRAKHHVLYLQSGDERHNFSRATVFNWLSCVRGYDRDQWLPLLVPQHRGSSSKIEIEPELFNVIKADYLRPERPSFMACYERTKLIAQDQGWALPNHNTLRRRLQKSVPHPVQVLLREGPEELERMFPAQKRDRTQFHALEAINADGHIWDVFVHDNEGDKPYRPVMCAIQDLYSGKILGWRIGRTLGSDIVRLAFGDVFRNFGIPDICWLDNGREFAAKLVTGGTATRFRFKVKEEEPVGFLTALGVDVRWTRPYRGQSKPIERGFRDFCDHIAKHPVFAGAYTGNMVTNKPSNYGKSSVPIETFKAIVNTGIELHNARDGRRTLTCQGKYSFDHVFNESYATSTIRKASQEQLRLCLLAGELKKSARHSGAVQIHGNTYWSEEMANYAGDRFVVRFDPDDLHGSVYVYQTNGAFLCEAPCWDAAGFADVKAGREHANAKKKFMKAQKDMAALEVPVSINEVAALLPDIEPEETPETNVVQPVFGVSGNTAVKAVPAIDFDVFGDNVRRLTGNDDD